jgi:peptide/nickel transport system permease protein/peptide/nickel transport system substrate-binding protein
MHRRTFLTSAIGATVLPGLANAQTPRKGGVLRLSAPTGITSFDPATGNSGDDHMQLYPLYDALIDYDFDTMQPKPGLATAWKFADPKTLVLDLRSGVKFHDNTDFNANAVKFNIERGKTSPRSNIKADLGSVESVEVASPTQVVLHLSQPDAALPLILADRAGMMVSPTAQKARGDAFDWNPVGTGAMKFVEWRDKERSTYAHNENYWKPDRPYLDGMQFAMISETQTGLRSVITGENDLIYALVPQQLAVAKRAGNLATMATPTLASTIIYINSGHGPLADPRVRKAFNLGLDQEAFNKATATGILDRADTLLPKEHWAYDKAHSRPYPYDPDKARQLLKEAGFADGVELTLLAFSDQLSQQRVEVLIEQLKPAGIRLKVTSGSLPEQAAAYFGKKQGDLLLAGWTGRPDPTLSYTLMFSKGGYFNPGGAETPGLEAALAATRASPAQDARIAAFAEVQRIVYENQLYAPLLFQSQIVAYANKVQGYRPTLLGKPRFDDVWMSA